MAISYTIDAPNRLAWIVMSGTITGRDIADTLEAVFTDASWQFGFDSIWDGRQIAQLLLELDDNAKFRLIQREHASRSGPGRDVVIVARAVDHSAARVYQALARGETRPLVIVASRDEALAALGRSPAPEEHTS